MSEARIQRLENLVKVLCELAGVEESACENQHCVLGNGTWADGEACSFCDGTRKIIRTPIS